jgi:hypothetical protein
MRVIPETFNRQDWPRLVSQTINAIIEHLRSAVGVYYMIGNTDVTTISTVNVGVKVEGTTTPGAQLLRFTHSDNRLTYSSGRTRLFLFQAIGNEVNGGNNDQYAFSFYKNGVKIPETEKTITADSGGNAATFVIQGVIELKVGDYVELFVENQTDADDLTVSYLNVVAVAVV